MLNAQKAALTAISIAFLSACGGGGGGSDSSSNSSSSAIRANENTVKNFSCNIDQAAAAAPKTSLFTFYNPSSWSAFRHEVTWPVRIEGVNYALRGLILIPELTTQRAGTVFFLHGNSPAQAALDLSFIQTRAEWDWLSRGYAVVYVARRGNYGSEGAALGYAEGQTKASLDESGVSLTRQFQLASQYSADSMLAGMRAAQADPRLAGYMDSIALVGASGGAISALTTAATSDVFKAATHRAIARITGANSNQYLNDAVGLAAERESEASKGPAVTAPTFWIAGQNDNIANAGQLACVFSYYKAASQRADQFAIVPGFGHGGYDVLFSPPVVSSFSSYMRAQGFSGF